MSITLINSSFTIVPYNSQIYSSFPNGTFSGTLVRLSPNASGTFAYTFGQVFKKGDVAAGAYLVTDSPHYQVNVLNRWNDGSVKFAMVSGTDTFVSGVDKPISVTTTPFPPTGTPLTETDLLTVLGANDVTMDLSGQGTASLKALVGIPANVAVTTSNGRLRTHISGPVMSEWHYRTTCGSSAHLRVYFYVRLYLGGQLEVEVNVENGYINVPAPTNLTYNATLTVNGTQRYYSASYLHYYRTRWSTISWWDGADATTDFQRVLPKHSWDYMTVTKMIPNYKWRGTPSAAAAAKWITAIAPGSNGNMIPYMPTTGGRVEIGLMPQWCGCCSSNSLDAIKATVANAYALNSWGISARDENTGYPAKFSQHPNTSGYYGQEKNWQRYVTGSKQVFDTAHNPNPGYMAYLLTARWYIMETIQLNAVYSALSYTAAYRYFEKAIMTSQDRGRAWQLRNLGCASVVTPDSYADQQIEYVNSVYYNAEWLYNGVSDGAGGWKNNYGHCWLYASSLSGPYAIPGGLVFGVADWQEGFITQAYGFVWDICAEDMLTTSQKAIYQPLRDFFYKFPVGRMGGTGPTECNYTAGFGYSPTYGYTPYRGWSGPASGTSGPVINYYPNWAWVYSAQFTNNAQPDPNGVGGVPNPGTGLGGRIYDLGGDFTSFSPMNPTSFFANCLPALTYAVSHGAPGAAAAWERVKSAVNFPPLSSTRFNDQPQFGIYPYGE